MATAAKTKSTTPAAATAPTGAALRAYQNADPDSGEVVSKFKYLPGHPLQVRFDAKAGEFNVNGKDSLGSSLSFVPMAWRIFHDRILGHDEPKMWAEIFFTDSRGRVAAVLFHGYSVENLFKLIEPLFYDDLTLGDVRVTATATEKRSKSAKNAQYFIAEFSYEPATEAEIAAARDFAADHLIYRAETVTGTADVRMCSGYRLPSEQQEPQAITEQATA